MTVRIAPSLLASDFSRLAEEIRIAEEGGADLLHLDLMDGHFVPNLTFGPPVVAAIGRVAGRPLDAHLMVERPDDYVGPLADAGVARVAIHPEGSVHLHRSLAAIREAGMTPGVALNPHTPVGMLAEISSWIEFVLVMSVDPGFGGQSFIPEALDKVRRIRAAHPELEIAVDGGVDRSTAGPLAGAGATVLVAGSAVFGTDDPAGAIAAIRDAARGGMA